MGARPRVVLVGRGRMAGAFAASDEAHVPFHRVAGRGLAGANHVAKTPGSRKTIWILAVTDSAIRSCASALLAKGCVRKGDTVIHLAGARSMDELEPLRSLASVGVLHPLIAVAARSKPPTLRGGAASFEGGSVALRAVRSMAEPIGLRVMALRDVDRVRYHAAAALVATGVVALAQGAEAMFRASAGGGVGGNTPRRFAASLVASVAHNVGSLGAEQALASPLMRGDTATIERHLAAMKILPRAQELYAAALRQVLTTLEHTQGVDFQVITRAKAIVSKASAEPIAIDPT